MCQDKVAAIQIVGARAVLGPLLAQSVIFLALHELNAASIEARCSSARHDTTNNHRTKSFSIPLPTSPQPQSIVTAMATKRRSGRQAASRKRSKYVEPDTDDDFDADEASDDGEADYVPDPHHAAASSVSAPAPKKRKVTRKTHRPQTRSKATKTKPKSQTRIIGHTRKPRTATPEKVEPGTFKGPSNNITPDWAGLPVGILQDIFVFGSQPLDSDSVSWLLKVSRMHRNFTVPALEAYYDAPAFLTTLQPHHLLELLRIRKKRVINYNTKVKRLKFEMTMLSYTAPNRALFDLSELVAELPQLRDLEITNPIDRIPYRRIKVQQYFYPANLFQTLEQHGQRLKTWRWSRDMISDASLTNDPLQLFPHMASVHEGRAFQRLETLSICGFDEDDSIPAITGDDDEQVVMDMPWTIAKLPNLKDLTFISCNIVRDDFLSKLPAELERLEITNCWKLDSNMLSGFLTNKGSHLKELVLKHNIALNLAFLTTLATSCPRLETLCVDGHYYSERQSTNDADPEYDELLSAVEVPTWPTTLRHISLMHLSKWAQEGGTNLFRTLVDSAPTLPALRHLEIKAHINIPWRDRAGFRDMWTDRLQRVYLRHSQPPHAYHGSKLQYEMWRQLKADNGGKDVTEEDFSAALDPNRLSHVRVSPHKPTGDTDVYDTDATASPAPKARPARRSTRVKNSQPSTEPESAPDNDSDTPPPDDDNEAEAPLFVQGLCEVVKVAIDNQRPRENMFSERDFLDAERSGDEDWNEDAEIEFEDNRHAW
jgi:hypothetical protein